jgi:CBS domain-containing protein
MTTDVLTAGSDWSLDRLAEFFVENSISGAPVTGTDGKLVGVVSLTDIVRHGNVPVKEPDTHGPHDYYLQPLERRYAREEISSFRIGNEPSATAKDIMTPTVFEVREDASVQEVADAMIRGCIHRVFVTRDDKVVGVISALDMLKVVRDH